MIYILEDDKNILELLIYSLNSQNIEAHGFLEPLELESALKNNIPQILVLDVMLPQENGFEILKKIRANKKTQKIIVIMLTALNGEMERIKGLDLGADDYITKPFSVMEFLARIKSNLRRLKNDLNIIQIKNLTFCAQSREVKLDNKKIDLSFKEFELLKSFVNSPNIVLNREDLLENIWGYSPNSSSRTLDIHIKTLRKKLGDFGQNIKTIRQIGYKLEV